MKAIVHHEYGTADVLRYAEIDRPSPGDHEVLVRVRAASLNHGDRVNLHGEPRIARLVLGPRRPRATTLGRDIAGTVEAVGARVTRFRPGDEVFGEMSQHGFAEYVAAPESYLAPKPAGVTFAQAATLPVAGTTALQALRVAGIGPTPTTQANAAPGNTGAQAPTNAAPDKPGTGPTTPADKTPDKPGTNPTTPADKTPDKPGTGLTAPAGEAAGSVGVGLRVLVNGASGGVGTFTVQLAKMFGAQVTGVCSTRNVELVRSLGADRVIDYTAADVTRGPERFDVVIDLAGNHRLGDIRRVLTPRGVYVASAGTGGGPVLGPLPRLLGLFAAAPFARHRLRSLTTKRSIADLIFLAGLIEQGRIAPAIERNYPLSETAEAIRRQEAEHARGKVVLSM